MIRHKRRTLVLLATTVAVTLMFAGQTQAKQPPSGPAVTYDLTLLPAVMETAVAMNQNGDIVGDQYLYISAAGQLVDLSLLIDPVAFPDVVMGVAADINDGRQIVGSCSEWIVVDGVPRSVPRAFLATVDDTGTYFEAFALLPLTMFIDGQEYEAHPTPEAINNNGHVVGTAYVGEIAEYGEEHAFLWTGDTDALMDLIGREDSGPPYFSSATDINDVEQIVGRFNVEGDRHGYRLTLFPNGTVEEFIDLGGLPKRPNNYPTAINQQGDVTGRCQGPRYYDRAYLYSDDGGITDLGTLFNSRYSVCGANDLNSRGHVVGGGWEAHDWTDPRSGAFLYTEEVGMVNVSTLVPDWDPSWIPQSLSVTSIIDPEEGKVFGAICGRVTVMEDGVDTFRGCLLTPVN